MWAAAATIEAILHSALWAAGWILWIPHCHLTVMTMTKEPAIWALSIPRIVQAFSLSHGALHDYLMVGLMMHFLAFARVVLGDLWFSHLILIRPSLLLLSFSSVFFCHSYNNWNHKNKFCKACQKCFLKREETRYLQFQEARLEGSYSSASVEWKQVIIYHLVPSIW